MAHSPPGIPPSIEALRTVVARVCSRHPHRVARVELFGSLARGEARPDSDVDLLVEYVPGANAGLLEMGALREDLEDALGRRVDLVSRRAIEKSRNRVKREAILGSPIVVYVRP